MDETFPYAIQPHAREPIRSNRETIGLEHLPAEILECVAWLSASPVLSFISKTIFQKLGFTKDLQNNIAKILFTLTLENPATAHTTAISTASNFQAMLNSLPFSTAIARTTTPLVQPRDLFSLRILPALSPGFTLNNLRHAGDTVLMVWLSKTFTTEEFSEADKNRFVQRQQFPETHGQRTTDECHWLSVLSPYHFRVGCRVGTARHPGCATPDGCQKSTLVNSGSTSQRHSPIEISQYTQWAESPWVEDAQMTNSMALNKTGRSKAAKIERIEEQAEKDLFKAKSGPRRL